MTQMPKPAILMANAAAWIAPQSFTRMAVSAFVTPRARRQSERGRDFLETLARETFPGPNGAQRAYAGGDGPTLFFMHGWEADSADLATHAEALMQAGYRVVLIDGPAHGESEGRKTSMLDFAAGLGAAAQAFGAPHGVVAHSMGCPSTVIATARGLIAPQVFVALASPRSLPENVEFQGRSMGLTRRAVRLMLDGIEKRLGEPIEHFDIARDAPAMRARALFVHGTGDQIVRAQSSHDIAQVWPGAEVEFYDGLGHRGVLRDARVTGRILSFLR